MNCPNTFENDIKHTKNYIKELIEYYIGQKNEKEKTDLKNRLIKIFEIVKSDIPMINDIYCSTINMFLENKIMEIMDLEAIGNELSNEYAIINKTLKNLSQYSVGNKEGLTKLNFVANNKDSFKYLFEE